MEGVYRSGGAKAPKLKSLAGEVSPLTVPVFGHSGGRYRTLPASPILDPYASSESSKSPLLRYLLGSSSVRGRSPLASIENVMESTPPRSQAMFKGSVNVEEDVLVMDGISVNPKPNASRTRSSPSLSNSGGKSSIGSSSTVSGGGGRGGGRGKDNARLDMCQFWKESGSCRFGASCLFLHGSEELSQCLTPPTQSKKKAEAQIGKAHTAGSGTYGSKGKFVHGHKVKSSVQPARSQAVLPVEMSLPTTPEIVCPEKFIKQPSFNGNSTTSTLVGSDWSPLDDGIDVTLPCLNSTENTSSRDEVITYIQSILNGSARRRRLQVFADICHE